MLLFCSETGEADLVLVLGVRCSLPPLPPPSSSLETPPSAMCKPTDIRTTMGSNFRPNRRRQGGREYGSRTIQEGR